MSVYYIIAERDDKNAPYQIAWGSYDKNEAIGERDDMLQSGMIKACNVRLIKSPCDSQTECDATIAALNARCALTGL